MCALAVHGFWVSFPFTVHHSLLVRSSRPVSSIYQLHDLGILCTHSDRSIVGLVDFQRPDFFHPHVYTSGLWTYRLAIVWFVFGDYEVLISCAFANCINNLHYFLD